MSKKNKNKTKSSFAGRITGQVNRMYDFLIVGTSVSLSLNNLASDIMVSGDDTTTKATRLFKRLVGRFTGFDVGEGGQVLNFGGAISNGQFLAGVGSQIVARILGEGQRMIGARVIPTGKIKKWGRINTVLGFGTGLISEDPPALSTIIKNQFTSNNGGGGSIVTTGQASELAVN